LAEEEQLLLQLMKVVQRDCFENKKMSMEEYDSAMFQYEKKLSEEKIEFLKIIAKEITPEEIVETQAEPLSTVVGTQAKQISFEDLLGHNYADVDFVKVEDVPVEVEIANEAVFEPVMPAEEVVEVAIDPKVAAVFEASKVMEHEVKKTVEKVQESKISSLNDRLNKSIAFGLNDRIGFEKKLFGGSSDDFNRVISQLNTFDNFEEAREFVQDFVKPDYNNWEGKEEFESRFMEIVEKKFS
jgi:hypothetical protein